MKKLVLISALLALMAAPALATPSLGWWEEGAPGTTHERWDFTDGSIIPSGNGYTADPEVVSNPLPNGVLATITHGVWDEITKINGSAIDIALEIPNYENDNAYKEIWVDIGGADLVPDSIGLSAWDHGSTYYHYAILPGQGDADFGIRIWPNPYGEKVTFEVSGALDYINVDTICIPAPGAILLGSIGISLVGWLRRRRTL